MLDENGLWKKIHKIMIFAPISICGVSSYVYHSTTSGSQRIKQKRLRHELSLSFLEKVTLNDYRLIP